LPDRVGRGVSVQFVFGTYLAQVADVEVSRDGAVRVRRVVCAVDCGTVINPDTVRAQIQSAIIFGVTAALYGEITLTAAGLKPSNLETGDVCPTGGISLSTHRPLPRPGPPLVKLAMPFRRLAPHARFAA
jgi:hypothetical protein